ncbi:DnaK domain protein [Bacteriovorax sp. BSW11_IV]|uniref:Hsp70 family protein n=1 Tax=Bacteriovorax sp. BSW11_IV TaxID=1353529 RepID=UPI00038A2463|nr:Hsp70 family protein [Bacteriovorax sp. BSW11_IV]EQC45039.1 DnaK domain protein [Bacteriovorax sp. BSW11_IV]
MKEFYAIDFGTSNSLLAHIDASGVSKLIPMDHDGDVMLKSLIFTPTLREWYFGKHAIEMREENDGEGRFFRSIKKFLAESNFKGTEVHGQMMPIEKLVSTFLKHMKKQADKATGKDIKNVVLGRPARYSLDDEKDKLAEQRMMAAAKLAGFDEILFCPEPLAAGLSIAKSETEELVMIADFGGGTSDFTILKVHNRNYSTDDVMGMSGVFLAGDALDGRMMKEFISPHFGSRIEYRIPFNDGLLKFPKKLMNILCSPAHISVLRERETWDFLKEIQTYSVNEEYKRQLSQLFILVEEQLAYPIYREIEKTKIDLSSTPVGHFQFLHPGIKIHEDISEGDYKESISEVVAKIKDSMLESFTQNDLEPKDIQRVYITGGTGQSPYIQEMLRNVFGANKISGGEVFQSVISGLAEFAKLQQL